MPAKPDQNVFRAIIFDMDGVIIDSKELVESFWIEKFNQYNLPVPTDHFEERFHGRPARLIIDEEFSALSQKKRSEMKQEIKKYDASASDFKLISGIEHFLSSCIEQNIPIALVTSALPPKVKRMISSLILNPSFKTIVTADRVENGKPDPECYSLAIKEMGIKPERAIVFEDSISGTISANTAGASVIGVNEPHMSGSLRDAGADFVIENFKGVTVNEKPDSTILISFPQDGTKEIRVSVN